MRAPRPHSTPHQAAVVESDVMGRSAVAVVAVVALLPTALGQITGWSQGSRTLDALGVPHLATAWAWVMLGGCTTMVLSYLVRQPDDSRVWEITTNLIIAIGAAVHLIAILREVGWSGSTWVVGMDLALIVNCGGRALFLCRQILWVAHRAQARRRG